jgi:thiaminase
VGASRDLLAHSARLWSPVVAHPFVQAISSGELDDEAFRRWIVNDHYFNVEYQRFVAGVAGIAPTAAATESIAAAIPGGPLGLDRIRRLSTRFNIDLADEPAAATVAIRHYLHPSRPRGNWPFLDGVILAP